MTYITNGLERNFSKFLPSISYPGYGHVLLVHISHITSAVVPRTLKALNLRSIMLLFINWVSSLSLFGSSDNCL